ncbi:hypothetical protein BV898_12955 [Hypsibius exemplaris]|uniref:Uncharacterized protein n=1 Tax=Hypsibius exemplaris TaxID=2072580 RepID=A0A1W0WC87_HYPEX|nr:hypothetical protein BV898_12955 [Hypsibius exemplaris]
MTESVFYHPTDGAGVGRGDLISNSEVTGSRSKDSLQQDAEHHHETGKGGWTVANIPSFIPMIQPASLRSSQFYRTPCTKDVESSHTEFLSAEEHNSVQRAAFTPAYPLDKDRCAVSQEQNLSRTASVESNIAYCTEELDEPAGFDLSDYVSSHDTIARRLQSERNSNFLEITRSDNLPVGEKVAKNSTTAAGMKDKKTFGRYWRRFRESLRRATGDR